jgi:hypothetical protein
MNKRIFFAVQEVGIAPVGTTGAGSFTAAHSIKALQSVGITTNFNLEQLFEMGQIEIYQNIENLPDIEVTLEKCLDGSPLIYHLATPTATSPTLNGRSNVKSTVALAIFSDNQDSASGAAISEVIMSGMFVSSLNYNFNQDGNFTESVTLVGNNKIWHSGAGATFYPGRFNNTGAPPATEGVNRRQHFLFGSGATSTKLPAGVGGVDGIDTTGYNLKDPTTDDYGAHVQSIRVSCNMGRDNLHELGRKGPFHRYVPFPVEVRCEIEVLSTRGDMVEATEVGVLGNGNNLGDKTIDIYTTEGTRVYLGTKCKLSNVTHGNANAGNRGGNATNTYTYTAFSTMTVTHPADPAGLT